MNKSSASNTLFLMLSQTLAFLLA